MSTSEWAGILAKAAAGERFHLDGGLISTAMLEELVAVAPTDDTGRSTLRGASFREATLEGDVTLRGVHFADYLSFDGCTFCGEADFSGSVFHTASFRRCRFRADARLEELAPMHTLDLREAWFERHFSFGPVRAEHIDFSGATFGASSEFLDVQVDRFLNFVEASFERRPLQFTVGCRHLSLRRARFHEGATLRLHGGAVEVVAAQFLGPSSLRGSQVSGQFLNIKKSLVVTGGSWLPRLTTLAEVDVANLVLADVDLSTCTFGGAHGLDKLRFETRCPFDHPPAGRFVGASPPFLWWWSDRLVIAEERAWRSSTAKRRGWMSDSGGQAEDARSRRTPKPGAQRAEQAERLAKIYRQLRKGREDERNEPGAADFYYGEMEMRRHGTGGRGERLLISSYWLVSGYALRPLRALVSLVVICALAAALLSNGGLHLPEAGYLRALQVSFGATVGLDLSPPSTFTTAGNWVRIPLRVLGPLLYALVALSIRGRVRR